MIDISYFKSCNIWSSFKTSSWTSWTSLNAWNARSTDLVLFLPITSHWTYQCPLSRHSDIRCKGASNKDLLQNMSRWPRIVGRDPPYLDKQKNVFEANDLAGQLEKFKLRPWYFWIAIDRLSVKIWQRIQAPQHDPYKPTHRLMPSGGEPTDLGPCPSTLWASLQANNHFHQQWNCSEYRSCHVLNQFLNVFLSLEFGEWKMHFDGQSVWQRDLCRNLDRKPLTEAYSLNMATNQTSVSLLRCLISPNYQLTISSKSASTSTPIWRYMLVARHCILTYWVLAFKVWPWTCQKERHDAQSRPNYIRAYLHEESKKPKEGLDLYRDMCMMIRSVCRKIESPTLWCFFGDHDQACRGWVPVFGSYYHKNSFILVQGR